MYFVFFKGIMLPSKWEELSRCSAKLIHFSIGLQADQILFVNIYFFNFGRGFCGGFFMLFPKAPASSGKINLTWFLLHYISNCTSSKYVSQTFKILF